MSEKGKIINDPVYGFLRFPEPQVMQVINHPWFQRLRRIAQMGLSYLVYPGAEHTRFHHSLGASYLMGRALDELTLKGFSISNEEKLAARLAILMHDIGHGPFSHSLESVLVPGVSHEAISSVLIQKLINDLQLPALTYDIFSGGHSRPFLHQLVSSQIDVDRMDYLNRDSYYSGVSEGVIGYDRILQMLSLRNDELVVEEKAIYSVEKFLIARRLMYWQVYLHKTVLGAELLLVKIIERARRVLAQDRPLVAAPALKYFLGLQLSKDSFFEDPKHLEQFCLLDDSDVIASAKIWMNHDDKVLATLSQMLINRQLFKMKIGDVDPSFELQQRQRIQQHLQLTDEETNWFIFKGHSHNATYDTDKGNIIIEKKDGTLVNLSDMAGSLINNQSQQTVSRSYLCYFNV